MTSDPIRAEPNQRAVDTANPLFPGRRLLPVSVTAQPTLLVAIDTEEEFDWRAPPDTASRSVTNVGFLPLLQDVLDRMGVIPAYLVDHPVATSPEAVALLRGFADSGRCEIGAHLHPWVTPPVEEKVDAFHAFACNLPPELERRKLHTLTETIAEAFGLAPKIFRAGVYGVSRHTSGFLAELGYAVDSSIVPYTDFTALGGPDFRSWTTEPFLTREGIVEIPLSTGFAGHFAARGQALFPRIHHQLGRSFRLPGIAARLSLLERLRLSPEGHRLDDMQRLTRASLARGERIFMMSMHSSSFLPGATGYVRTEADRTAFLKRIENYLRFFIEELGGRPGVVSDVAAALKAASPGPQE